MYIRRRGLARTDSATAAGHPQRVGASRTAAITRAPTRASHSHGEKAYGERFRTSPTCPRSGKVMYAMVPAGSSTNEKARRPSPQAASLAIGSPVAPHDPEDGDQDGEQLQVRREGDGPGSPDGQQERDGDLGLAHGEAPGEWRGQPAEDDPRPPVPPVEPDDGADEEDDQERLPDQRRGLEWQQGQWPEQDRQERRVPVEVRVVRRRGLLVERQAGVESRPGVVVGVDVGQGIDLEVDPQRVEADHEAQDRRPDDDIPDAASLEQDGEGHAAADAGAGS